MIRRIGAAVVFLAFFGASFCDSVASASDVLSINKLGSAGDLVWSFRYPACVPVVFSGLQNDGAGGVFVGSDDGLVHIDGTGAFLAKLADDLWPGSWADFAATADGGVVGVCGQSCAVRTDRLFEIAWELDVGKNAFCDRVASDRFSDDVFVSGTRNRYARGYVQRLSPAGDSRWVAEFDLGGPEYSQTVFLAPATDDVWFVVFAVERAGSLATGVVWDSTIAAVAADGKTLWQFVVAGRVDAFAASAGEQVFFAAVYGSDDNAPEIPHLAAWTFDGDLLWEKDFETECAADIYAFSARFTPLGETVFVAELVSENDAETQSVEVVTYSVDGERLWSRLFDESPDFVRALGFAVDGQGSPLLNLTRYAFSGEDFSGHEIVTVKLDSDGGISWIHRFSGESSPMQRADVAVGADNVAFTALSTPIDENDDDEPCGCGC